MLQQFYFTFALILNFCPNTFEFLIYRVSRLDNVYLRKMPLKVDLNLYFGLKNCDCINVYKYKKRNKIGVTWYDTNKLRNAFWHQLRMQLFSFWTKMSLLGNISSRHDAVNHVLLDRTPASFTGKFISSINFLNNLVITKYDMHKARCDRCTSRLSCS